jgi:hypothetical protein
MAYLQIDGYSGTPATVVVCPVSDPLNCYSFSPLTNVGYSGQTFPVLIPLPSQFNSAAPVNVTVTSSNGCYSAFTNVSCGVVPTPTPTVVPGCDCTTLQLNAGGTIPWTVNYVDCSGNTTTYTESVSTQVSLCNRSIIYTSGTYSELSTIYNCSFNGSIYTCPSPTPTPTRVTPTPTPTSPGYIPASMYFEANSLGNATFKLVFGPGAVSINWGDGNVSALTSNIQITHTYSSPYTGQITVSGLTTTPNKIENISSIVFGGDQTKLSGVTSQIGKITSLTSLGITGSANFTYGDVAQLSGLTSLYNLQVPLANALSGNIANLPHSLNSINIGGSNTLSGNIGTFSANTSFINLTISGLNTISGNLINLNQSTTSMGKFEINGSNTITGDMQYLPNATTTKVTGSNTISGNLSTIKSQVHVFDIEGSNTISGDLSGISSLSGLTLFKVEGNNTISGNISSIPNTVNYFNLAGNNTISGDLVGLNTAAGITEFTVMGYNTITGNINKFSTGSTAALTTLTLKGNNTVYGAISGLSTNLRYLKISSDNNQVSGATIPKNWPTTFGELELYTLNVNALSQTFVDDLFIRMNTVIVSPTGSGTLVVNGAHANPSATSLAARNSLIGKGFSITT